MLRRTITTGLLLLATAFVLDACTGTLPGYEPTGTRQTARYRPPPTARPTPPPRYEPLSPGGRYSRAPEPTPSSIRERPVESAAPASRDEPVSYSNTRKTSSRSQRPAPTPAPVEATPRRSSRSTRAGVQSPSDAELSQREQRIAILTNAVTTLRRELSESYEYTEELEQERERLQTQVQRLRKELADSQAENDRLRKRLEELQRRLEEISPPRAPATPSG